MKRDLPPGLLVKRRLGVVVRLLKLVPAFIPLIKKGTQDYIMTMLKINEISRILSKHEHPKSLP